MEIMQIVILVFVLLVVLYLVINAFSKSNKLTSMSSAKLLQTIKADTLKNTNNSSNFTYSMWIYVDDWNYKFGQKKTILDRGGCPTVTLGDKPNTLTVNLKYFSTGSDSSTTPAAYSPNTSNCATNAANAKACQACNNGFTCACANCDPALYALTNDPTTGAARITETSTPACSANGSAAGAAGAAAGGPGSTSSDCTIDNIPIQKWVNVIISLYGSTLDTYLNGKLVRTCVLPGVPNVNNNADISVTPKGGFSGWTTSFKYWSDASNPQDAYNIYKAGFGGSILGNAISKYRFRFSTVKDNIVTSSFEI
jgi:hypothetical protein